MYKLLLPIIIAALTAALVYPVAAVLQHGISPDLWPDSVIKPSAWFHALGADPLLIAQTFVDIGRGRSPAFANGGWSWPIAMTFLPIFTLAFLGRAKREIERDPSNIFGSARFATDAELAAMDHGLEFGLNPRNGRPIRVQVQGTLVSIAPPRKGKTAGLIIANLACADARAWSGPAVVIDPKGEVYRAVAARRRALGRRVICVDPFKLVGGADRWNPFGQLDPSDTLYLLHTARTLLPEPSGRESDDYFRNRAASLLVGAMLAALLDKRASLVDVHRLFATESELLQRLRSIGAGSNPEPAALAALDILTSDPKTKDPIKNTAGQAFDWLIDRRTRHVVAADGFQMREICGGEVDLFLTLPTEYIEILAPFIRLLLSDLFTAVRRYRPKKRILVFLDEAAALGRFKEVLTSAGELPGYGLSLWSFWQTRAQMVMCYGEAGAATIIDAAEMLTLSDLSGADPDERERWSRAIGQFTAVVESSTQGEGANAKTTKSKASQGVSLLTKEDLAAMPPDELIVLPNSAAYARHPFVLKKTFAFEDPRIKDLVVDVRPVGSSG